MKTGIFTEQIAGGRSFSQTRQNMLSVSAKSAAVEMISILESLSNDEDKLDAIAVLIRVYTENTEVNQALKKECKGLKIGN